MPINAENEGPYKITSAGDLEIATLVEHQDAFPDLLTLDLYAVLGQPPDQTAMFHNDKCFELFWIRAAKVFAESPKNVEIEGKRLNLSLFGAGKWFRDRYPEEAQESGLTEAVARLEGWLDLEVEFEFWCSELNTQFKLMMTRGRMISFAGNLIKHNLLRINKLLGDLQKHLKRNGYEVNGNDIVSVLDSFKEEYRNRLLYHATYFIEMLYDYFWAFNAVVWRRFYVNGCTNDHRRMIFPAGSTVAYQNLYGSALVFRRYEDRYFGDRKPITNEYLKTAY